MMPTTTRAAWAANLFEDEADFMEHAMAGETAGLELLYDEEGLPYLDEGECQGPFAGEDT